MFNIFLNNSSPLLLDFVKQSQTQTFSSWHFTWKWKKIYFSGIQSFQHTIYLPAALHWKEQRHTETEQFEQRLKSWSSKTRWPYSQKSDIKFDLINFYLVLWNLMNPIDFQVYNSIPIINIRYWLITLRGFITIETDSYD